MINASNYLKIVIPILLSSSVLFAQDGFEEWLAKEQQKFQEFKDKRDKAFVEFLEKQWQGVQLLQGISPDKEPKPLKFPVAQPKEIKSDISKPIKKIEILPPQEKETESVETFISKMLTGTSTISFSFFNTSLKINFDKAISEIRLNKPLNEKHISNFWADLGHTDYEDLLEQSLKLKKRLQLNDWGYYLLLAGIAQDIFPKRENEKILLIWFLLAKSGYDAKVCFDVNGINLLLPSGNTIYGLSYFIMDNKRYYLIYNNNTEQKPSSVYTYDGNYPGAEKLISLKIDNAPAFGNLLNEKKLQFKYGTKDYEISFQIRNDIIDFYEKYPQTNLDVYFNAVLSSATQYSLLKSLKSIIEGKTEIEAVNILLRFVQTAFDYKNDKDQFGREKPFFAEETLFYPFSDCEDRSVLFAFLVRELIGLDVIGLDYPGHIATAVKFNTNIGGDFIIYNNEKYLICDATYINANIGQKMQRFQNVTPKVISLSE